MTESSFQTPIFFILFPGYSPSKEVEAYGRQVDKTVEAGNLTLISMGQGQEKPAEACLDRCEVVDFLVLQLRIGQCCIMHHWCII